MSELEYSNQYAVWLNGAGLTPTSNPINLRGVIKEMLANWPTGGGGGSGTVTSVSVASANGLTGSVANPTTTPAITLSTSITGVLKGNGTAISAAVASTDYIAATTGSALQKASSGGLTAATAGTDYPATGVISAGGPTGAAGVMPVLTYNANGQLTAVTTTGTVGSVAATDSSIVVGGSGIAPTIQRAALTGDATATAGSNAVTVIGINGTNLAGMATGLLKNTTATGVPTIATAGTDYPATGVITGGSVGSSSLVPVLTYNANGQLTAVTTAAVAAGTIVPGAFTLSTITANPNPGVAGTYYRCNYAGNGSFTLPSTSLTTGEWLNVKNIAANTITITGTVDGQANTFTLVQYQSAWFVYNGATWDAI